MVILNCNNISQFCCFYCIFKQINAAFVSKRNFSKNKKTTKKNMESLLYGVGFWTNKIAHGPGLPSATTEIETRWLAKCPFAEEISIVLCVVILHASSGAFAARKKSEIFVFPSFLSFPFSFFSFSISRTLFAFLMLQEGQQVKERASGVLGFQCGIECKWGV